MRRFLVVVLFAVLFTPTTIFAQEGRTYAFDLRTRDNFLSFPASDPGVIEFIDKNVSLFAIDFSLDGSILYAVDSNVDTLGMIDQTTGQFSAIAPLSGDYSGGLVAGLSIDPTGGSAFMHTGAELFTLNLATGETMLVGAFTNVDPLGPAPGTMIDISINSSGQMFVHELDPDGGDGIIGGGLWSVDKNNAVASFIAPSGLQALFAQGMDFDPDTDTLYAAIYTGGGTGSYGTWDTTTGVFTEILDLPSFGPVELEIAIFGNTTYGYNFRTAPNQFLTFPLNNPLPITSTEDVEVYETFAIDFDVNGTTLILFNNITNFFGSINTDNGCFTPMGQRNGDLVIDPAGISCDPTTGMFYAVADGGDDPFLGPLPDQLYAVDPVTGTTTLMSVILDDSASGLTVVVDIAIDSNGQAFVYDIGTDSLYSLDLATGTAALVGDTTAIGDSNFAQGMDFDPITDTLYQAVYTGGGTGSYGSWDLASGTFTEILPLPMFQDPIGTGYEFEMAIGMPLLLGDINCDGIVSLLDVAPFVDLVTNGGFSSKADFNADGMVTLLDVAGFVTALIGP